MPHLSNTRLNRRVHSYDSNRYLLEHSDILTPLLSEMEKTLELTVLKVTAHLKDPASYPLIDTGESSLETILLPRLKSLSAQKKEIALSNLDARMKKVNILANSEYANLYSYGVIENLSKPVSVFQAANELFFVKSEALAQHVNAQHIAEENLNNVMADTGGMQVYLRIHKIKCVDETNPETGDDEISLAANILEVNGNIRKIEPILIRDDFDGGEEQLYNPVWNFTTYNVWERFDTQPFPRYCSCLFILSELDNGGLSDKVEEIYTLLRDAVVAAIGRYGGGLFVSGVLAGPLGVVLAIAVGFLLDKLFDLLKEIWEDDLFAPQLVERFFKDKYSNFDGNFFSPVYTCVFEGFGGVYTIDYSWQMKGVLETPHGLADGWEPVPETLSGAIIYKDTYYNGESKFLAPGRYSFGSQTWRNLYRLPSPFNNEIDSIQVGKGYYATLYKSEDYTGPSIEVYNDTPTPYFNDEWRDQISSVIVGRLSDRIG